MIRARWAPWAGLAFLYLVWGAGWPAAQVMIQSIPPLTGMAGRSLLVGAALLVLARARRGRGPRSATPRELGWALMVGLLVIATSGVAICAMRHVPAGVAALVAGSLPLWVVALQTADRGGPARVTDMLGVAVGLCGLALLVAPMGSAGGAALGAVALLIGAAVLQAAGTLTAQRVTLPADALTTTGVGMVRAWS